jgi:phosphatidylglycerophosphatase A
MILAAFLGGWEILLIMMVVLIVFGAAKGKDFDDYLRALRDFAKGLGQGIKEFRNASDEVTSELQEAAGQAPEESAPKFSVRLFVAQGFGIGWIPFAPGTFGSFLGLGWFAILVATGNFWAYLAGAIEGIAFSIWLCDDAEKILGETDPGSVVLDEIIAIPFCFMPWVATAWFTHGAVPSVESFFTGHALGLTLGLVVLFRVFDIWKPWPVRQIQRLPGGWGVTVDDLMAAGYVAALSLLILHWW